MSTLMSGSIPFTVMHSCSITSFCNADFLQISESASKETQGKINASIVIVITYCKYFDERVGIAFL